MARLFALLATVHAIVRANAASGGPTALRAPRSARGDEQSQRAGADAATVAIRQAELNQQCMKLSVAAYYTAVGVCSPMLPDRYVSLGSTASRYGQGVAAYSAAQLGGAFSMGVASDRLGHKPVLILASLGTAVTLFASAFVADPNHLIAMRGLSGLFGGIVSVARGAVGAGAAETERAGQIAGLSAASSFGLTLGPLLVALLGTGGRVRLVFGAAAALNLLSAIATCALMPAAGTHGAAGAPAQRRARQIRAPTRAGARAAGELSALLVACAFVCSFAFTAGFSTYPLLARRRYGFGARELGLLYASASASNALSLPAISRRAVRQLGLRGAGRLAQVVLGCAIGGVALAPSRAAHLCAFWTHVAAYQLADSSFASLASLESGPRQQGRAQGVMQAATSAGRVCSPLVCAALFTASLGLERGGPLGALLAEGNLPFVLVGAAAALSAALLPRGRPDAARSLRARSTS